MTVCMTCLDTARRWRTWDDDPLDAVQREIYREPRHLYEEGPREESRLRLEMRALAALAEKYADEFADRVKAHSRVPRINNWRRSRRRR